MFWSYQLIFCFPWKAWPCDVTFLSSIPSLPLLFHRRHVFYLQHHLDGRFPLSVTQLSSADSPGGTSGDLHRIPAGPHTAQAMEVDGLSDCSKQGYSQETKRLKRTPAPDSLGLEMEHRFIDQVLSTCRNVEQARFANAYRKWLDTLSQWKVDCSCRVPLLVQYCCPSLLTSLHELFAIISQPYILHL